MRQLGLRHRRVVHQESDDHAPLEGRASPSIASRREAVDSWRPRLARRPRCDGATEHAWPPSVVRREGRNRPPGDAELDVPTDAHCRRAPEALVLTRTRGHERLRLVRQALHGRLVEQRADVHTGEVDLLTVRLTVRLMLSPPWSRRASRSLQPASKASMAGGVAGVRAGGLLGSVAALVGLALDGGRVSVICWALVDWLQRPGMTVAPSVQASGPRCGAPGPGLVAGSGSDWT